jgi:hypothetical protein
MRIETSETMEERIAKADGVIVLCQMIIHHQLALVPECELQSRYIESANQHRRRSAVQWALRIMRKQCSWTTLRQFISEQRVDDLNTLAGARVFPVYAEIRAIYDETMTKVATKCGVETHKGESGEVAVWPLTPMIRYCLDDPDLFATYTFPICQHKVAFFLTHEQYLTITGTGGALLEGMVTERVAAAEDDEDDGNFEDVMDVEPDEVRAAILQRPAPTPRGAAASHARSLCRRARAVRTSM